MTGTVDCGMPGRQDNLHVRAVPHAFAAGAHDMWVPAEARLTLHDIVARALPDLPDGVPVVVSIGDMCVPKEHWHLVRPKAGHVITVRPVPMGGGGDKNILGTILSIAVLAAAAVVSGGALAGALGPAFAAGGLGATALAAGISVVGGMLVNAIAPPPKPRLPELGGAQEQVSPTLFIEGARNQARPYGVIPRVFGRHRMLPPLAAQQYTEIQGDEQFVRGMVTWGYGPVAVEDLRIGDTPISTFSDVQLETRAGAGGDAAISLYPNAASEMPVGTLLVDNQEGATFNGTGWQERRTAIEADEISVDITLPQGLYIIWDDGRRRAAQIVFMVQYRPAGGGAWNGIPNLEKTTNHPAAIRLSARFAVPRGQYDVRVAFGSFQQAESGENIVQIITQAYWSALRAFRNEEPLAHPGLARTAFRIRATDQLSGPVDTINGVVTSVMRDYDGSDWETIQATRNPASHMLEVLTEHRDGAAPANPYRANARAVADERIDWEAFEAFHDRCAAKGWSFDHVVDYRTSVWQLLSLIATAGRASPGIVDGKWSVVMDMPQVSAVQMFTPRNSWGFRFEQVFPDHPHALRCGFLNADKDWQADELTVYADGFDASSATRIEGVDYPGVTSPAGVWARARFDIAQARLRPAEYSISVDVENLTVTRGDLVEVAHDVLIIGQNYGRLASVTEAGGLVTALVLDDLATMEAGKSYAVRIRRRDLTSTLVAVVTDAGETDTLALATPTSAASLDVAAGDLFAFGESGIETARYLVTGIEPGPELTARVRLVDEAPAVHTADQGTIPDFDSKLGQRVFDRRPPVPRIEDIRSDESVLVRAGDGTLEPRVVIRFQYPSGLLSPARDVQARVRFPGGSWIGGRIAEARPGVVALADLEEGQDLEVSLRAIDEFGRASDWSVPMRHTVVGKSSRPADVEVLFVERDRLRWEYPSPPLDFAGFRVRVRSSGAEAIADATPAHAGLVSLNEFPLASLPTGTRAVMVSAVDTSGNESAAPAVALFDLGDPLVANVVDTVDLAALGFPGAISGGTVAGNGIQADGAADMWDAGTTPMWSADTAGAMWSASYAALNYSFDRVFGVDEAGAALSVDADIEGDPWLIEYRRDGAGRMWAINDAVPMWQASSGQRMWRMAEAWRLFPGSLTVAAEKYFFRVRTGAGATRGRIAALTLKLDVPDVVEYLDDVVLSAGGTRLPLTKAFRAIRSVNVTLQDDAGSAVDVRVMDKDTAGPLIQAFDAGGSGTSGLIDAIIQGY